MDSIIKSEKFRAMKCYKNSQFVYNLILSSFVALTCSFFCSHPFGFASLTSSIKYSLFIYLPNIWSSFLNPKCLFIVFNVIVAFLVGESKLLGSQSSPDNDIYDEYVARSRRFRGVQVQHKYFSNLGEEQKEERKLEVLDVRKEIVYEDKEIALEHKQDKHDHEKLEEEVDDDEEFKEAGDDEEFKEAENNINNGEHEERDCEEDSEGLPAEENNINNGEHEERDCEEDSEGLPAEELNRRVEDFIARINKQRWFEARMMICGQA